MKQTHYQLQRKAAFGFPSLTQCAFNQLSSSFSNQIQYQSQKGQGSFFHSLERDHCHLLPSFPDCICAAVISQNSSSWLLHWVAEIWPISTPVATMTPASGITTVLPEANLLLFQLHTTSLNDAYLNSQFHSMSIILEIAWLEYILQVYIYIYMYLYIFFSSFSSDFILVKPGSETRLLLMSLWHFIQSLFQPVETMKLNSSLVRTAIPNRIFNSFILGQMQKTSEDSLSVSINSGLILRENHKHILLMEKTL